MSQLKDGRKSARSFVWKGRGFRPRHEAFEVANNFFGGTFNAAAEAAVKRSGLLRRD
jgi:hypothetical protein